MQANDIIPLKLDTTAENVPPDQQYPLPQEILDMILLHVRDDSDAGAWKTTLRTATGAGKRIQRSANNAFFLELDLHYDPSHDGVASGHKREVLSRVANDPLLASRVRRIILSAKTLSGRNMCHTMVAPQVDPLLEWLTDILKKLVCLQEIEIDVRMFDSFDEDHDDSKILFWRSILANLSKNTVHLWFRGSKDLILSILAKPSEGDSESTNDVALAEFFGRLRTLDILLMTGHTAGSESTPGHIETLKVDPWFEMPKLEALAVDWQKFSHWEIDLRCVPLSLKTGPRALKSLKRVSIRLCVVSAYELVSFLTSNQESLEKIALNEIQLCDGKWEQVFDILVHCKNLRGVHFRRLEYLGIAWERSKKRRGIPDIPATIGIDPVCNRQFPPLQGLYTHLAGGMASLGSLVRYQHGKNNNYLSHRWGRSHVGLYGDGVSDGSKLVWHPIVPDAELVAQVLVVGDADQYVNKLISGGGSTAPDIVETDEWNRHFGKRFGE